MSDSSSRSKPARKAQNAGEAAAGFYASSYDEREMRDLASLKTGAPVGLQEEIAMLRVVIRRVFEQANRVAAGEDEASKELAVWSRILANLGTAAARLATLLRTEKQIAEQDDTAARALSQAINEVLKEMEEQQ